MADEMCTRGTPPCGKPLDTDGSPKWCRACRAKYRREYEETKEGRAEAKGFARGVRAMQEYAAQGAEGTGSGMLSGHQVAHIIRAIEPHTVPALDAPPDQSA